MKHGTNVSLLAALLIGQAPFLCAGAPVGAPRECSEAFTTLRSVPEAAHVISEFRALDALGHPTIAINASTGTIEWMTPKAQSLLETGFGTLDEPSRVPPDLQTWIARVLPGQEIGSRFQSGDLTLQVRGRLREDRIVLIGINELSLPKFFNDISKRYGLTAREAEVFYWIAKGKTNNDIGTIIGAAGGTVKKHAENIFRKLGLSNRTQPTQMLSRDFPESI